MFEPSILGGEQFWSNTQMALSSNGYRNSPEK
jgi:hypothetical protein